MKAKKSLIVFLAVIISMFLISCGKNAQVNNTSNVPVKTETLGDIKIHYIDVGQGDSELIQIDDKNILIDAGTSDKKALEYLKSVGVTKLDYVIATHPHKDHIGSMDNVIENCSVGTFYAPKVSTTTNAYENMINSLGSKNVKLTVPKAGDQITIGNATITFLAPNSSAYEDINNYSIVVKLKYGNNSFIFMGDAQALSENEMLTRQLDVQADVLKVGQHGSDTSTSQAFLNKVNPKYAVISCGKDDSYQHPNQTTIEKLNAKNIEVFRTDLDGTVIATTNGKDITFNVNH
jgi:beta-lactamase superfamily II metal-dependent hydrolase